MLIPVESYTSADVRDKLYDAYCHVTKGDSSEPVSKDAFFSYKQNFDKLGIDSVDRFEILMKAASLLGIPVPEKAPEETEPKHYVSVLAKELRAQKRFIFSWDDLQEACAIAYATIDKLAADVYGDNPVGDERHLRKDYAPRVQTFADLFKVKNESKGGKFTAEQFFAFVREQLLKSDASDTNTSRENRSALSHLLKAFDLEAQFQEYNRTQNAQQPANHVERHPR